MAGAFTPAHRGGRGAPLLPLHGFTDTWRTWELVLPALGRHHDVLPGNAAAGASRRARRLVAGRRAGHVPGADRVGHRGPAAAVAERGCALPGAVAAAADWVTLDGVGHCIQLDVPAVAADLILGFATG
jgi:pimeloyl-ACP methyl ester carboxylesterase